MDYKFFENRKEAYLQYLEDVRDIATAFYTNEVTCDTDNDKKEVTRRCLVRLHEYITKEWNEAEAEYNKKNNKQ